MIVVPGACDLNDTMHLHAKTLQAEVISRMSSRWAVQTPLVALGTSYAQKKLLSRPTILTLSSRTLSLLQEAADTQANGSVAYMSKHESSASASTIRATACAHRAIGPKGK